MLHFQTGDPPFLFLPPPVPATRTVCKVKRVLFKQGSPLRLSFILSKSWWVWDYLQNQDEIVNWLVSLIEVVQRVVFALGVEFELLHDAGVFDETQQDLVRQVARPERLHFCKTDSNQHFGGGK